MLHIREISSIIHSCISLSFLQLKVSEIISQTQYFFDQLAKGSTIRNKIGLAIAKGMFYEGLDRLGVGTKVFNPFNLDIFTVQLNFL